MKAKTLILLMVAGVVLTSCRDRAVPEEATVTPPAGEAGDAGAVISAPVAASNAVDESKVQSFDAEKLASASWTRNACSLDMVDKGAPGATLKKGEPHLFEGFMLDQNGEPAGDFFFVFKGATNVAMPISTGKERPDVAEYFKSAKLASAGFEFSSKLSAIATGEYEVVFVLERDGASYFCESGKRLSIQ